MMADCKHKERDRCFKEQFINVLKSKSNRPYTKQAWRSQIQATLAGEKTYSYKN